MIPWEGRAMSLRRVGVEEEFLLIEPRTGRLRAVAGTVLQAARHMSADPGCGPGTGLAAQDAAPALEAVQRAVSSGSLRRAP